MKRFLDFAEEMGAEGKVLVLILLFLVALSFSSCIDHAAARRAHPLTAIAEAP